MWILKTKVRGPRDQFEFLYFKFEVQPNGEESVFVTVNLDEAKQFETKSEADACAKIYFNSDWEAILLSDEESTKGRSGDKR